MNTKLRAKKILDILKQNYPDAKISLSFANKFELLVAVMLSAQTTDVSVNKVTPGLFNMFNKNHNEKEEIKNFANANIKTLEKQIKSIGLYKTKARNIKKASEILLNKYNGRIPDTMTKLLKLPGVGRKTANVVLSHAFNKNEGVAVDTHVKRLANALGLTKEKDPSKIEWDLMQLFERKDWGELTNLLIAHGRKKDKSVDLLLKKIKD